MKLTGKTQEQVDLEEAQEEQLRVNAEMRQYLSSTDWYVTRKMETGKEIPQEVELKREEARNSIVEVV